MNRFDEIDLRLCKARDQYCNGNKEMEEAFMAGAMKSRYLTLLMKAQERAEQIIKEQQNNN